MIRWKGSAPLRAALAASLALAGCGDATGFDVDGLRIYGLDGGNNLVEFGSRSPDRVRRRPITGLQEGEILVGLDFRAADDRLLGVGSSSRLYFIDTDLSAATAVAGPFVPSLGGEAFGVSFNPVSDRMRVHGSEGQNLRLDPVGSVAAVDPPLTYAPGDPGAITTPRITGSAHTIGNPTTLYGIDSNRDALVVIPSADAGVALTVGPLGMNTSDDVGFEITDSREGEIAFVVLSEGRVSRLYRITLSTGEPKLVGRIATRTPIRSIAIKAHQTDRP
ncbi:MAG: DUF4394 domain-containing protein [Gemmatimonadetes bacterium]|nr:DUF4394 domain-containing protein [Gemmatimonadota bacterium]